MLFGFGALSKFGVGTPSNHTPPFRRFPIVFTRIYGTFRVWLPFMYFPQCARRLRVHTLKPFAGLKVEIRFQARLKSRSCFFLWHFLHPHGRLGFFFLHPHCLPCMFLLMKRKACHKASIQLKHRKLNPVMYLPQKLASRLLKLISLRPHHASSIGLVPCSRATSLATVLGFR